MYTFASCLIPLKHKMDEINFCEACDVVSRDD